MVNFGWRLMFTVFMSTCTLEVRVFGFLRESKIYGNKMKALENSSKFKVIDSWPRLSQRKLCNRRFSVGPKWAYFVLKQQSYGPWWMSKMLCASFPYSNFSTFLPIFFRLCTGIGIGQEWYGIASGIISFRNNIVMALDLCPKCIFGQYLKN